MFVPENDQDILDGARGVKVQVSDQKWLYIEGHVIDGRNLFPATGYLYLVWETLALMRGTYLNSMNVVFENCKFMRATALTKKGHLQFNVMIQRSTGNFEIIVGDSPVVTGRIYETKEQQMERVSFDLPGIPKYEALPLTSKDIYKELRLRGYNYNGAFRALQECDVSAAKGRIKWEDNWVTFMDNMLQMAILREDSRLLYVPTFVRKLAINAKRHVDWIAANYKEQEPPSLPVSNNYMTGVISCGGIQITGLIASSINRRKILAEPVLESYKFIPNFTTLDVHQSVRVIIQLILESALSYKVKSLELIDEFTAKDVSPLTTIIKSVLKDLPLIQPYLKILSKTPLVTDIEVEDKKLNSETNCLLVVASHILERHERCIIVIVGDADYVPSSSSSTDSNEENNHRLQEETMEPEIPENNNSELDDEDSDDVALDGNYNPIQDKGKNDIWEEVTKEALEALSENGFIISRESPDYNVPTDDHPKLTIISAHRTPTETVLLLQKKTEHKPQTFIKISSSDQFSWVATVKEAIKNKVNDDIVLYSENEPNSGLIGLVNCLRREPNGKNIKCVFVMDEIKQINLKTFSETQLKKNMAVNVYKNGQWGTYRHLLLNGINVVEREHCFVNSLVRGDLSSLTWLEGPLNYNTALPSEKELVHIYYTALNFRDVMTALGKVTVDIITTDRRQQECVQGFEFSGRDSRGNRVMGMITNMALATVVAADRYLLLKIPDSWTMADGATAMTLYGTLAYGLFIYNGEYFQQHEGTTMGNSLSPFIANLFMSKFETEVKDKFEYFPRVWFRYVDDIFAVFDTKAISLDNFVAKLNNRFPTIKFTYEVEHNEQLPFLDVLVIRNSENKLEFDRGQLKRGESILIHSGTGGIGQAAIRLALHYGCTVFTTVGTQEKRKFIRKTYPEIEDSHIGNSRDLSFEHMVHKGTNGRGVDMVVNSLAEDKLLASVRCLARGGRFIEIGKFDMALNNYINLQLLQRSASFHGVMLDQLFTERPSIKKRIMNLLEEGIENGTIKPLNKTIFKVDEVEQAFRYMASGKHTGKVLVQVRTPEEELIAAPTPQKFSCMPRYLCDPAKTYIICGGLGGFGLELADWLVLRGAKNLILTSRKGISTGYQNLRIRIWTSYGTIVKISKADICTEAGCEQLLEEASELGPVDSIFNLAVVLADAIFENQTPETFQTSFAPKANATRYLDDLTRTMCPDLRHFVVFSSVSCGRGNAGQTNYGMANSVMERLCEKRREDGYPALAIEWGAVGEVGLVAEMQEEHIEMEIGGTLQQRISNCLQVLDTLLAQKEAAIVSSMVVAEKRGGDAAADNIVDSVINILGVTDKKTISLHSTLPELGMDSMTGVEIKQTLEREYDIFLTPKDMRTITLARLKEMHEEQSGANQADKNTENRFGFEMLFTTIGDVTENNLPYMRLNSKVEETSSAPKVVIFPGIEGVASYYEFLSSQLDAHVICLQYLSESKEETIADMANAVMPVIEEHVTKDDPINIIAYSYGTVVALEAVSILESRGYRCSVMCVEGSPKLMKGMLDAVNVESTEVFETALACRLLSLYLPLETVSTHQESIFKCTSWDEKVELGIEIVKQNINVDQNHQRKVANRIYRRVQALKIYTPSYAPLESDVKLYKAKYQVTDNIEEDYCLSQLFKKPVEFEVFEGNHATVLDNEELANTIAQNIK
ncbi:hypothetical protein NQ318_004673 [Aromia moschata]|uniref:oleoyl-[acyl-carrier-protein] hydrolase n=1 Tax=Aromia moschata TaxID=1265417 RepID=A0AAV8Y6J6_9CUCU|nr:hypothetical protein NQ318_004673 [Aromia moschata]